MRMIRGVLGTLICAALMRTALPVCAGEIQIPESRIEADGSAALYVKGIPPDVPPSDLSLQIGRQQVALRDTAPGEGSPRLQTLLMLDNSWSMKDFEKAQELLIRIIEDHGYGELFRLVTFSEAIVKVSDIADIYTEDYESLKEAVRSLTLQNQNTLVNNVILQAVRELQADPSRTYKRIVIISDGGDPSYDGSLVTLRETDEALMEDPVAVYCITADTSADPYIQGITDMAALGREFGGFFSLTKEEDAARIFETLRSDQDVRVLNADIPEELQDGEKRNLLLTFQAGEQVSSAMVSLEMPFLPKPPQEPSPTPAPTPSKKPVKKPTFTPPPAAQVSVTIPPPQTEKIKIPWLWIGLGGGSFLLIILCLIPLLAVREKKKRRQTEDDLLGENAISPEDLEPILQEKRAYEKMLYEEPETGEETQLMFEEPEAEMFALMDVSDPSRFWKIKADKEIRVGKSAKESNLVITGDKTISRCHLRVSQDKGDCFVMDLGSTNGTWLNGERILGKHPVHKDDILHIGNRDYRVFIGKDKELKAIEKDRQMAVYTRARQPQV